MSFSTEFEIWKWQSCPTTKDWLLTGHSAFMWSAQDTSLKWFDPDKLGQNHVTNKGETTWQECNMSFTDVVPSWVHQTLYALTLWTILEALEPPSEMTKGTLLSIYLYGCMNNWWMHHQIAERAMMKSVKYVLTKQYIDNECWLGMSSPYCHTDSWKRRQHATYMWFSKETF